MPLMMSRQVARLESFAKDPRVEAIKKIPNRVNELTKDPKFGTRENEVFFSGPYKWVLHDYLGDVIKMIDGKNAEVQDEYPIIDLVILKIHEKVQASFDLFKERYGEEGEEIILQSNAFLNDIRRVMNIFPEQI